jgi:hypothetical protein
LILRYNILLRLFIENKHSEFVHILHEKLNILNKSINNQC